MKKYAKYSFFVLVGIFAVIGVLFTAVFFGMRFGLFNVRGSISERNQFFAAPQKQAQIAAAACANAQAKICDWSQTPEWAVVRDGLMKDAPVISRVSAETGVPARLIAAAVVPEQMRFFTSNREVFKRYFEPLKILGTLTQFSLGVSGIKQETAAQIEANAASTTSPFYPGAGMAELIAYPPEANRDTELYHRLTDAKDHYYSYLYTALYIKEIEAQWKAAGYDISNDPAAIVTLFNIGFAHSKPNADPRAGGSQIAAGGAAYRYGELGAKFYESPELENLSR